MCRVLGVLIASALLSSCSAAGGNAPTDSNDLASTTVPAQASPVRIEALATVDNSGKEVVDRCNRDTGSGVIVTFDDKGTREEVIAILDVLDELNWRGAFFPIGEWSLENWDLVQLMQQKGHIVGSHTMTHADLVQLLANDADAFYGEIYPLRDFATTKPMLLRPPYGSGLDDPQVAQLISERDIQLCGWTADTNDWRGGTATELLERVMEGYEFSEPLRPDGVVLAHINGKHTVEFVRLLAEELDKRQWSREPLDQ